MPAQSSDARTRAPRRLFPTCGRRPGVFVEKALVFTPAAIKSEANVWRALVQRDRRNRIYSALPPRTVMRCQGFVSPPPDIRGREWMARSLRPNTSPSARPLAHLML
jgi:hypothetical protein